MPPEPFSDVKFEIGHVLFIGDPRFEKIVASLAPK